MKRKAYIKRIRRAFKVHPVVAVLGPRCGKTTLAKLFQQEYRDQTQFHYFDLEDPRDLARLDNPMLAIEELRGTVIIDEVQLRPELFPVLRVLVDKPKSARFLILGSASRDLLRQSSETLAGRIQYIELTPFSGEEAPDLPKLWLRGGYPRSYLARNQAESLDWRLAYVSTYLERDIPKLGIRIPSRMLRRFWMMLAHYHGNIFNASELGRSLGIAHTTARHYLDILTGTFMVRELTPWFANVKKRQVKSPKVYLRDSGILHTLLGISDRKALEVHPKLGASWEGFALEEVVRHHRATPEETYFWGVHGMGELDLLLFKDGKRLGFEFKYADAPTLTKSMAEAAELLELDQLHVIYPGDRTYSLAKKIQATGLNSYLFESR